MRVELQSYKHGIDSIALPARPVPNESWNHLATDSFAQDLDYSNPGPNVLDDGAKQLIAEQRSTNDVDDSCIP